MKYKLGKFDVTENIRDLQIIPAVNATTETPDRPAQIQAWIAKELYLDGEVVRKDPALCTVLKVTGDFGASDFGPSGVTLDDAIEILLALVHRASPPPVNASEVELREIPASIFTRLSNREKAHSEALAALSQVEESLKVASVRLHQLTESCEQAAKEKVEILERYESRIFDAEIKMAEYKRTVDPLDAEIVEKLATVKVLEAAIIKLSNESTDLQLNRPAPAPDVVLDPAATAGQPVD